MSMDDLNLILSNQPGKLSRTSGVERVSQRERNDSFTRHGFEFGDQRSVGTERDEYLMASPGQSFDEICEMAFTTAKRLS